MSYLFLVAAGYFQHAKTKIRSRLQATQRYTFLSLLILWWYPNGIWSVLRPVRVVWWEDKRGQRHPPDLCFMEWKKKTAKRQKQTWNKTQARQLCCNKSAQPTHASVTGQNKSPKRVAHTPLKGALKCVRNTLWHYNYFPRYENPKRLVRWGWKKYTQSTTLERLDNGYTPTLIAPILSIYYLSMYYLLSYYLLFIYLLLFSFVF